MEQIEMHRRKAVLIDLAAHRELTPEQRQEVLKELPEAGRILAAYQEQDELLAALPRP